MRSLRTSRPRHATQAAADPDPVRARTAVVVARLVLLSLAATGAASAAWMASRHEAPAGTRALYVCPMHPEVTSAAPGQCPICRMDLERLAAAGGAAAAGIEPSTYLNADVMRLRGTGPDTPAPAWVDDDGTVSAIVYDDELEGAPPDARARFEIRGRAGGALSVRAVPGAIERWDRSTERVRFRPDAPDASAPPGAVGRLRLIDRGRELPVLAQTAVLEGADGPYVLAFSKDGRSIVKRSIAVGKSFGGLVFVRSGLAPGERVLTRSAFFVDAERKMRRTESIEVSR